MRYYLLKEVNNLDVFVLIILQKIASHGYVGEDHDRSTLYMS